ncbi:MAG: hydantoinase/oxoprolinase N-terminal domain-containing protein, partial [Pseudomonadota bacterium]
MSRPAVKVGVDIGGTFTDVVMEVGDRMISTKVLTTYSAPEDAILAGLQDICSRSGTALSDIDLIIHGTTLATNALIERRGAHAALVTTKGFRDVIEMRTEGRFEQYDLNLKLPDPLISRQHRHVVNERIASDGRVLIGLEDAEIEALVEVLRNGAYQSVAVGFLHAYQNPVHEQKVGEAIRKSLPNVMVSLSSEVSPQMR